MTHLLLTIFLGWTGYARFRKGQIGLGVLWFFTVGCFTVGWIIDIIDAVKEMNKPAPAAAPNVRVDFKLVEVLSDFYTKVVGVTFKNADGSDRQEVVSKCHRGQELFLKPCFTKEYPEAIGVFTADGKQLGNVKADLAHEILTKYPDNPMKIEIEDITGGGDKNFGCNIRVQVFDKTAKTV
jgi:hypothetical protein